MSKRGNGHDGEPAVTAPDEPVAAEAVEEPTEGGLEVRPEPGEGAGELEALRRERDALQDALLRRRADFENYRRRVERDRGVAASEAEAALLRQFLGTLDNLERALGASGTDSSLREGVELTHRELITLLATLGVATIDPLGERFDPISHQAIVHEAVAGFAEGTVAEVYRKGYSYRDRLLRPALVKVASGGGEEPGDDGSVQ